MPVEEEEEEVARVARVSLEDLEGFAKELVEEDWDLDDALWILCQACRAQPLLQHKAGLLDTPWLTQLMVQVLSAVAPGTEHTSLWLSNSTAQSVHADHHNLQGSSHKLWLPPNGGDLWWNYSQGML